MSEAANYDILRRMASKMRTVESSLQAVHYHRPYHSFMPYSDVET
jgi:hypothetical protein